MAVETPDIKAFETEDEYHHIRFRDPDRFDMIRTPDWAANAAADISEGAEVRTGKKKDSDDWEVESVLIRKDTDEDTAKEQARKIVAKIED